jgi:plastocyanin
MKRTVLRLVFVGLATITAACGGASAAPSGAPSDAPSGAPSEAPAGDQLVVVAKDLAFAPASLTVPAGAAVEIVLDNQESAPHNIAIKDASGAEVFKGEIVSNASVTNAVPALAAGSYTFWCEVHPDMQGTITAE